MDPLRIEGGPAHDIGDAGRREKAGDLPDFEAVLREVDVDLDHLERLADVARRAASDEGPTDPEAFRAAVRESEEALRSACRIRSRLIGAYRATQGLPA